MSKSWETLLRVRLIERRLDHLEELIVALSDDLKASIQKLNQETDAIAVLISSLAGRIKNTMSDQEVADIQSALQAEADRLTTLAVDPTNPVPPPPQPLQAARAKVQKKHP